MVLTSTLLAQIRSDVKDDLEAVLTYGAVGTDDTTEDPSDTALGGEVFRDAVDDVDKSVADAITVSLVVDTSEANGNDINEAGLFDDPSAGDMGMRATLNEITKTSDITLFLDTTIEIEVTEE